MPFISFIIIHYNKPTHMLLECVDSILSLSLKAEERDIVVVDDESQSSPAEALKAYGDVIRFYPCKHQGIANSRNLGLSLAQGQYIQFVDSDDKLIPAVYDQIIRKVKEERMDMLMFRFTTDEQRIRGLNCSFTQCYKGADYLIDNNLRSGMCLFLFHKDVLNGLCFKPGIIHEDALFTPQLILQSKTLCCTTSEAYFYRQTEGSVMNSRNKAHIEKRLADSFTILLELRDRKAHLAGKPQMAMQRVTDQLVMGYLYFIISLTHSVKRLHQGADQLRKEGLFPLPLRFYTLKYYLFALLTRWL